MAASNVRPEVHGMYTALIALPDDTRNFSAFPLDQPLLMGRA